MKTKTPRIDPLAGRLATYSASALAALAVLPPAMAKSGPGPGEIQTIGASDFSGSFEGAVPSASITIPTEGNAWRDTQSFSLRGIPGFLSANGFWEDASNSDLHVRAALGFPNMVAQSSKGVLKVAAGQPINAGLFNSITWASLAMGFSRKGTATHRSGNFLPAAKTGYIGLKFGPSGANYYGWLRLQVSFDSLNRPTGITFLGDANGIYGAFALADTEIMAGQTSAIPEPANVATGLALFALGAVGVREFRRRRKLAA